MSYQLVNETLLMIDQEIDDFLMEFPHDHPFRMALSLPLFRQQLRAGILNKIPNRHKVYCDGWSWVVPASCLVGMAKERGLVETEIRKMMPEIINDLKHPQPINAGHQPLGPSPSFHVHEMAWWVRIHTIIPCVTYYFGPFTSQAEAKQCYPGYVADLKQEKAVGISVRLQRTQPTVLTVTNSPDDLKRDQRLLWQRIKQLYHRQSTTQRLLQQQWHTLPGNFLAVNFEGTIKSANARACQLLNGSGAELKGRSLFFYVPKPQILILEDRLEMMRRDERDWQDPYCWTMQLQVSAIALILVQIEVTQQRDCQGKVIGWYWLLHNMTPIQNYVKQGLSLFSPDTARRSSNFRPSP